MKSKKKSDQPPIPLSARSVRVAEPADSKESEPPARDVDAAVFGPDAKLDASSVFALLCDALGCDFPSVAEIDPADIRARPELFALVVLHSLVDDLSLLEQAIDFDDELYLPVSKVLRRARAAAEFASRIDDHWRKIPGRIAKKAAIEADARGFIDRTLRGAS